MTESVVNALRAHDRSIIQRPPAADPSLAPEIEKALPGLDAESRALAVLYLAQSNGPGAGNVLLKLSGDPSLQVAASAARSLLQVKDSPPGESILAAIPSRQDRAVRGFLYLAAGRATNPPALSSLRAAARNEPDPDAAAEAQVAAVKLGGDTERKAFLARIAAAGPDQALEIRDQMFYVGDPKLAKALVPWFANKEGVMRLGSDRQGGMVRMCDIATWIAHQLGVPFNLQPDYLTNYDAGVLAAAKGAVAALPD